MSITEKRKEILVYADWKGLKVNPTLLGKLYSTIVRGNEVFAFEYSDNWLKSKFAQVIDPDLGLYSGTQ